MGSRRMKYTDIGLGGIPAIAAFFLIRHIVGGIRTGAISNKDVYFRRDSQPGWYWFHMVVYSAFALLAVGFVLVSALRLLIANGWVNF
jgi:hypothetical protein